MKQIASLSAFLLLIGMPILGQPFIFINEPGEEIAYDILEFKDYYIISCTEYTQTNYNSYLIKLGHDGTIIDDTVIGSGLKSIKLYEFNDNIYIFSLQFNDSIDKGYLSFICMDTLFNRSIQKSLFVHPQIYSLDLFDVILTSDSLFLIVGDAYETGFQYPQNNRGFFCIKFHY